MVDDLVAAVLDKSDVTICPFELSAEDSLGCYSQRIKKGKTAAASSRAITRAPEAQSSAAAAAAAAATEVKRGIGHIAGHCADDDDK